MKRLLSYLVIGSLLIGSNVYAESKEVVKKNLSGTATTTNARLENVKAREGNRFAKMIARYQATIDRENSIMTKINSRIEKVKTDGKNTTTAEGFVSSAKLELDAAQSSLDSIKLTLDLGVASEAASTTAIDLDKDTMMKLKKTAVDLDKHLHLAHNNLVKAVGSLLKLYNDNNASTTTTNN